MTFQSGVKIAKKKKKKKSITAALNGCQEVIGAAVKI